MSSYGTASYGVDSYGQADGLIIQGVATTVLPIVPPPLLVTATQSFTATPRDLGIDQDGELMLTPDGDLAFVTGKDRVAQDVWMLAMQPVGSNYGDPRLGSALAGLIGTRTPSQPTLNGYAALLVKQIAALHQTRRAQGDAPGAGEALAAITATATKRGPTSITAALDIRTQDSQRAAVAVPLP